MTEPIKPKDVASAKEKIYPDVVIEAFNELIAETYNNGYATFQQQAVVSRMMQKGLKRTEIFKNHWLDVESIYRAAGWKVEYDSPGFNETYKATFTFKKKTSS